MTRQEHLDWCKQRAMEYVKIGDLKNAFASMMSDIRKHPETEDHAGIMLGTMLQMSGNLRTSKEMQDFIMGFN